MALTRNKKRAILMGAADSKVLAKYYRSDHWRALRAQKLARNPMCELCRRRRAKQVHHKTYGTLFREDVTRDLDAVCARCHRHISRR